MGYEDDIDQDRMPPAPPFVTNSLARPDSHSLQKSKHTLSLAFSMGRRCQDTHRITLFQVSLRRPAPAGSCFWKKHASSNPLCGVNSLTAEETRLPSRRGWEDLVSERNCHGMPRRPWSRRPANLISVRNGTQFCARQEVS